MISEHTPVFAAALVLLALASALISAFETAVFALSAAQIEGLRSRRKSFAAVLARLSEDPRAFLSAVLLADALVNAPLMLGSIALLQSQRWVRSRNHDELSQLRFRVAACFLPVRYRGATCVRVVH